VCVMFYFIISSCLSLFTLLLITTVIVHIVGMCGGVGGHVW